MCCDMTQKGILPFDCFPTIRDQRTQADFSDVEWALLEMGIPRGRTDLVRMNPHLPNHNWKKGSRGGDVIVYQGDLCTDPRWCREGPRSFVKIPIARKLAMIYDASMAGVKLLKTPLSCRLIHQSQKLPELCGGSSELYFAHASG